MELRALHQSPSLSYKPVNTIKGRAKSSYYAPKQILESVFERLAATAEAFRTILILQYLIDNRGVLDVFGYCGTGEITSEDRK